MNLGFFYNFHNYKFIASVAMSVNQDIENDNFFFYKIFVYWRFKMIKGNSAVITIKQYSVSNLFCNAKSYVILI